MRTTGKKTKAAIKVILRPIDPHTNTSPLIIFNKFNCIFYFMILNDKNQNDILNSELINSYDIEYVFNNKPINRIKTKPKVQNKSKLLENLKEKISNIDNCELKNHATQLVFSDGTSESQLMIVGEGPGQKEDELGKPFVGDAGMLLNKMLKAVNTDEARKYFAFALECTPSSTWQQLIQ